MTKKEEIDIATSKYVEDNSLGGEVRISSDKDSFREGADVKSKYKRINIEDDSLFLYKELMENKYYTKKALEFCRGMTVLQKNILK